MIESQRGHMEEMERASDMLREEIRKNKVEYEEQIHGIRQDQTTKAK